MAAELRPLVEAKSAQDQVTSKAASAQEAELRGQLSTINGTLEDVVKDNDSLRSKVASSSSWHSLPTHKSLWRTGSLGHHCWGRTTRGPCSLRKSRHPLRSDSASQTLPLPHTDKEKGRRSPTQRRPTQLRFSKSDMEPSPQPATTKAQGGPS